MLTPIYPNHAEISIYNHKHLRDLSNEIEGKELSLEAKYFILKSLFYSPGLIDSFHFPMQGIVILQNHANLRT